MPRGDKNYQKRLAASQKAAAQDEAAKKALVKKVNQKGGAGRLSRQEIARAKRMGEGEGQ